MKIVEAPLGDYHLEGDWHDTENHIGGALVNARGKGSLSHPDIGNNSFVSKYDRYLIQKPETEAALRKAFSHLPQTIHVIFFNHKNGLKIAKKFLDLGDLNNTDSPNEMAGLLGKALVAKIEEMRESDPDAIIFVLTHNEGGDKRHPITPWMIAHRMAHASHILNKMQSYDAMVSKMLNDNNISYTGQRLMSVLKAMCTFRAAREDNILQDNPIELYCEMFTQYLMTGKITLQPPEFIRQHLSNGYSLENFTQRMEDLYNNGCREVIPLLSGKTMVC